MLAKVRVGATLYWARSAITKASLSRAVSNSLKPFEEMPAEHGWPVIGALNLLTTMMKREVYDGRPPLAEQFHKHGDIFRLKLPGFWLVNTTSPDDAELVFRSEGDLPSRGPHENNMMWLYRKINLPPPMFFSAGEVWKKTRSSAAKQIVPRRVGNFVGPLCEITDDFLDYLETKMDGSGNVSDVPPEINKWAFQGVSYFVYGEKINTYTKADPLQQEFIEAGLDYIQYLGTISNAPPLYKIFPTKTYRTYVSIVHRIHAVGQKILKDHSERMKEDMESGVVDESKPLGLLDQWMIEGKFSEEEALSQSYDMLSAGIDTTANTSSFLLFELAKHPEIQKKIVEEVKSVCGDRTNPSWEDLQKMPLIRNCIKETMRLYMPVGGLPRILNKEVALSGYKVPAGYVVKYHKKGVLESFPTKIMVAVSFSTIARDERYISRPAEFIPERWSKDSVEKLHPFLSLPFGFGPRSCYGRRLAELEMYVLLVKMLPRYSLSTNMEKIRQTRGHVILRPVEPLQINFTRRA